MVGTAFGGQSSTFTLKEPVRRIDDGVCQGFQRIGFQHGVLSMHCPLNWLARSRCLLDMYLGQLCSVFGINEFNGRRLSLSMTAVMFHFTGKSCSAHTDHNAFDHTRESGTAFFITTTDHNADALQVLDGFQRGVQYLENREDIIADYKRIRMIIIPENSFLMWHGFLQHGTAGQSGTRSIWHHIYIIPQSIVQGFRCIRSRTEIQEGLVKRRHPEVKKTLLAGRSGKHMQVVQHEKVSQCSWKDSRKIKGCTRPAWTERWAGRGMNERSNIWRVKTIKLR